MLDELNDTGSSDGVPPVPPYHESAFGPAARRLEDRVRSLRHLRRKARRDLRVLLRVPAEEWADKVFSARTRFRSRAFAELLLDESRRRVKDSPREARELAALVPQVLDWIPGAGGQPWRLSLDALARAHRANALRGEGDLVAADRVFADLRRDLEATDFDDPRTRGEVASLEASLRIVQGRSADAAGLLDHAATLQRRAGDREGLARTLIKRANLARHEERWAAAAESLGRAAELLDPDHHAGLYVHAVGARALCLCDLGRFDEAEASIDGERERFRGEGSRWSRFLLLGLRGRIALGRGDHGAAQQAFTRVHEGALEMGRDLDAALAAVDLAQVYLEQERRGELRELAAGLVVAFRSRGLTREALAALRLLHRAVEASELDGALLTRVRRLLRRAAPERS